MGIVEGFFTYKSGVLEARYYFWRQCGGYLGRGGVGAGVLLCHDGESASKTSG